jgi:hypothetical protein
MLQKKKEGLVKQLHNYDNKFMNSKLEKLNSTCTCRYEQIEQTNTMVTLQIMVKGY